MRGREDRGASSSQMMIDKQDVSLLIECQSDPTTTVGITVNQFEDPNEPDFVFICPTIYVRKEGTPAPKHVVMLVDVSGSMNGPGIDAIHQTLPLVFDQLEDDDFVSLIAFSDDVTPIIIRQTKGALADKFKSDVAALEPLNSTALYRAITFVDKTIAPNPDHTTLLLFTDGQETFESQAKTVQDVVKEFSQNFDNNPPRLFPIGLGTSYDHEFMKQCSISANFGMIDARDQERLPQHVNHIQQGLAQGIQVQMIHSGEASFTKLGIMSYNTANEHIPIRIKKTDLGAGLTFLIDGHETNFPSETFAPLSIEEQNRRMQPYMISRARGIYDDASKTFIAKMLSIEELMVQYHSIMDEDTKSQLLELLYLLDKKNISEQAKQIALVPDRQSVMLTYRVGFEDALKRAHQTGEIKSRYPEKNDDYISTVISSIATGYDSRATISRVSPNSIQVSDSSTSNRFTLTSTLSSTAFTARMSRPPVFAAFNPQTQTIELSRQCDFSTLPAQVKVESSYAGRETIVLNTGSDNFNQLVERAKHAIASGTLDHKFRGLMELVRSSMVSTDLSRLGDAASHSNSKLDMDTCLAQGTGVCRHHSLLLAALTGKMVEAVILPQGRVTHYRAATNELKAHSFAVYTQSQDGSTTHYILDSAMGVFEKISTQEDFERCVAIYDEKGLHWILRNFATDHKFTYPVEGDELPIGLGAIYKLQVMAWRNRDLWNQLVREKLIPSGGEWIVQSPENKHKLWNFLIMHGCISPEELTEAERQEEERALQLECDRLASNSGASSSSLPSSSSSHSRAETSPQDRGSLRSAGDQDCQSGHSNPGLKSRVSPPSSSDSPSASSPQTAAGVINQLPPSSSSNTAPSALISGSSSHSTSPSNSPIQFLVGTSKTTHSRSDNSKREQSSKQNLQRGRLKKDTQNRSDLRDEPTSNFSFLLDALTATALISGVGLCVAAVVTFFIVGSIPLAASLLTGGLVLGAGAAGTFFYRHYGQEKGLEPASSNALVI